MDKIGKALHIICYFLYYSGGVNCGLVIPNELGSCFAKSGDIYLGYLLNMNEPESIGKCGTSLQTESNAQLMEAFDYTVNLINLQDDILPNITLGYVAYDT